MIDDLACWHKVDRAVAPATPPSSLARRATPTGPLEITHRRKPYDCQQSRADLLSAICGLVLNLIARATWRLS
jgi:hypothetical protein